MMPQVEGGPKKLNDLLAGVYYSCVDAGGDVGSCSAQAWGAAENDGWFKDESTGEWKQKVKKSIFEGIL
jgi:hypothetical protein